MVTPDVVVVGGSVAGSIAALELGRRGARVALLERARHPRPKACGEGLLPHGVAALAELGLVFPGQPVRGLRYVSPAGASAEADFPAGPAMVVRRDRFDSFLFDAAARTPNVTACPGTPYDPARWKARWVIGADGLNSLFHGRGDFRSSRPRCERVGLSTHVRGLDVDPERVEVIFHASGEVYLAPTGDGEALVACLYRRAALPAALSNEARVLATLRSLDVLRGRCHALSFTTPVLGVGSLGLTVSPVTSGRTLLVGDASGAPDPVVGEGMSLAILSARAAAAAIVAGRPEDYAAERRRLGDGARWVAGWILRASRHPRVTDRVVVSLGRHPEIFAALLGVVSGDRPKSDVTFADLLRLAA
jgi:flavin-dependent dehydrogenase